MLADPPGKSHRGHLPIGRLAAGHHFPVQRRLDQVWLLQQKTPGNAAGLEHRIPFPDGRGEGSGFQQSQVLLGAQGGQRSLQIGGRNHRFDEGLDERFRGGLIDLAIERDDASERGDIVHASSDPIGVCQAVGEGHAAGRIMLDDGGAGSFRKFQQQPERGV